MGRKLRVREMTKTLTAAAAIQSAAAATLMMAAAAETGLLRPELSSIESLTPAEEEKEKEV
jgi:hypothetical protein